MREATHTSQPTADRADWPTATGSLAPSAAPERRRRERILRATVELIAKRGYNGTSAERICKRAGVSYPTFRKHFRGKQDCFLAAFDLAVEDGSRRVAQAGSTAGTQWSVQIATGLDKLLQIIREDPDWARLCLVEVMTAGPRGIARYEAAVRLCIPRLRAGREHSGNGSALPPLLEETIAGGVAWELHQKVALGQAARVGELFDPLLITVLRPYLGEVRAKSIARPHRSLR